MARSLEDRVLALYVPGQHGYGLVAAELGISPSKVREIVTPGYREAANRRSAEAKRRRTGVCELCGRPTRYNGHGRAVSRICRDCNTNRLQSPEVRAKRKLWDPEILIERIRLWHQQHGEPPRMKDWQQGDRAWPSARSVIYHFGTWNKGIEAAGLEPRLSTPDHQRKEAARRTQARPSR